MYHKLNIRIITQTPRREMTSTYQLITFPQQLASAKVDYPRRQHALLENPASMDQRLKVNTIPPEIALNRVVELRLRGRAGQTVDAKPACPCQSRIVREEAPCSPIARCRRGNIAGGISVHVCHAT